jgi:Fe-S cluster biogenesis protein NfuA
MPVPYNAVTIQGMYMTDNEHMQSAMISVASPSDLTGLGPAPESDIVIDEDLLNETLEYIRPALQADGGDMILLGTEGGRVTLQLVGSCDGCSLVSMTLTAGIERILKDRVPGVVEVIAL